MTARQPEGKITAAIVRALNEREQTVAHKVHGGPYTGAGEPDIDCVSYGRAVKLEVKTPGTEHSIRSRVTPIQRVQLGRYAEAGAIVGVVVSVEEALAVVELSVGPSRGHDAALYSTALRCRDRALDGLDTAPLPGVEG